MFDVRNEDYDADDDNYDITNIHSDDSTDDESAPKMKLPTWAEGKPVKHFSVCLKK